MEKRQDQVSRKRFIIGTRGDPLTLPAEQGLPTLPAAPKMAKLEPFRLRKELPVFFLSIWEVVGRNPVGPSPENIFQIESPVKATAWQDQKSSKLYLENLDQLGSADPELKGTLNSSVRSLGLMSKYPNPNPNPLPDTIYVTSEDDSNQRMAAKKMVLGLLDFYKLPNKPILKETLTSTFDVKQSAIEFSVKNIPQIKPIMTKVALDLSKPRKLSPAWLNSPAERIYQAKFEADGALRTYQTRLNEGVVNGFRVEEVDPTGEMFQEIGKAAENLKNTIAKTITTIEGTDPASLDLATLKTLQKQVVSAIDNRFKNELDTRRWQQWLTDKPETEKPRTEDQIVPGTKTQIGSGAQGPVFKYELDPALGRSPVVLKYDSNGLNGDALTAGIPNSNPQQSVRAVAAFKISEHLNLDVIPRTEVFVGTDANGRPKLGQAMEVVNGAIGQRTAGLKDDAITQVQAQRLKNELGSSYSYYDQKEKKWYPKIPIEQKDIQEYEDIVNNPGKHTPESLTMAQEALRPYVKVNGKWYYALNFPVDIDYRDPVVQKGLSDLQVFDYIIGHADRNAGNWIYEKDNTGSITGVKGIDNDDTFGKDWSSAIPRTLGQFSSKTPGIPPIVDIPTALSILHADFEAIRPLLAGLSDEEKAKAAERFDQVKQEVEQRVMAGQIASSIGDEGVQAKLEELRKLTNMEAQPGILRWGDQGIAGAHTEQNSYLGLQLAQKNRLAQQYPESRGVLSESGDVVLV
jgi:hypothetical protein